MNSFFIPRITRSSSDAVRTAVFFPRITRSSRDALCTAVFCSTHHTLITWCSAHSSFSFHSSHAHQVMHCAQEFFIPHITPHQVMQCAQQFFIQLITRSSSDAVRTTVFHSTHLTLITWCTAYKSFLCHNAHTHHVHFQGYLDDHRSDLDKRRLVLKPVYLRFQSRSRFRK